MGGSESRPDRLSERERRVQIELNKAVQQCFHECVNDFMFESLTGAESKCIHDCFEKFIRVQSVAMNALAERDAILREEAILRAETQL